MNQPRQPQYATGQMAGIMRVQPAWAPWPEQVSEYWWGNAPPWRTVRAVPMTRRAAWKPWPWRTWGYPPGRMAYRPFWPDRLPTYWYGWWMPEAPQSMGWGGAAWPATTSYGRAFLPGGFQSDIVAGAPPVVGQMLYGPASQNYHPLPFGVDPLQGPRVVPPPFDPLQGPVPPTYG